MHLAFNAQLILPTFKRGVLRVAISQPDSAGRPAGLAPPVWYENLSGVVICPENSNINTDGLDSVVIGSRDQ